MGLFTHFLDFSSLRTNVFDCYLLRFFFFMDCFAIFIIEINSK